MSDNYFDLPSRIEDAFAEIDSDIVMDLLNADEDYAALSGRMDKLKTQYTYDHGYHQRRTGTG